MEADLATELTAEVDSLKHFLSLSCQRIREIGRLFGTLANRSNVVIGLNKLESRFSVCNAFTQFGYRWWTQRYYTTAEFGWCHFVPVLRRRLHFRVGNYLFGPFPNQRQRGRRPSWICGRRIPPFTKSTRPGRWRPGDPIELIFEVKEGLDIDIENDQSCDLEGEDAGVFRQPDDGNANDVNLGNSYIMRYQ